MMWGRKDELLGKLPRKVLKKLTRFKNFLLPHCCYLCREIPFEPSSPFLTLASLWADTR